jgi:hypothetical protein
MSYPYTSGTSAADNLDPITDLFDTVVARSRPATNHRTPGQSGMGNVDGSRNSTDADREGSGLGAGARTR